MSDGCPPPTVGRLAASAIYVSIETGVPTGGAGLSLFRVRRVALHGPG